MELKVKNFLGTDRVKCKRAIKIGPCLKVHTVSYFSRSD